MKLNQKSTYLFLIVSICIIFVIVYYNTNKERITNNNDLVVKKENIVFDSLSLSKEINKIIKNNFAANELSNLSLAIKIPKFNYKFNFNENNLYLNASTIKVPLNLYIYDLIKDNPKILNELLVYNHTYYEEGSGIMQATKNNTKFTVSKLLSYSIKYSDNIATNMLFDRFITNINKSNELIPYFGKADYSNWLSNVNNKMISLNYLYQNKNRLSTLMNDLQTSIYRDRIPKYLPKDVKVAIKTGDINATAHDMAIITSKNTEDYLIVVSVDNIDNQNEKVAKLSKDIYNILKENKKEK